MEMPPKQKPYYCPFCGRYQGVEKLRPGSFFKEQCPNCKKWITLERTNIDTQTVTLEA